MMQATRTDRPLPPPPRIVRRNPATLWYWQFNFMGRFVTALFASGALLVLWHGIIVPAFILREYGTETTGIVIDGEPYKNKGHDRFRIRYSYSVAGNVMQSEDSVGTDLQDKYEHGLLKTGSPIRIRYLRIPFSSCDEIVHPGSNAAAWCLIVPLALWLAMILSFGYHFWYGPRRMRRLCQYGIPVQGFITEIDPGRKSNRGWVLYTFTNAAGQSVEAFDRVAQSSFAEKLEVGSRVTVLALGNKSIIYELGPFLIDTQ